MCLSHRDLTQQTQNICITFVQRRPNVSDVGPTFYKCYANVLCLPESSFTTSREYDGHLKRTTTLKSDIFLKHFMIFFGS